MSFDIEFLLPNRNFPDYTAFSENKNPLYFQYSLPFLNEYINSSEAIYACGSHFEELVGKDSELQNEYVELFNINNEFLITQRSFNELVLDIYILSRDGMVLMFFIRKAL